MVKLTPTTLTLGLALAICVGLLSWTGAMLIKQWDENTKLRAENAELKASQVMLMVPDNQAQQLSDWLGQNPDQVAELIRMARKSEQMSVEVEVSEIAPEAAPPSEHRTPSPESESPSQGQPLPPGHGTLESVDEQGVKVIRLPHGGIRVTTREDN